MIKIFLVLPRFSQKLKKKRFAGDQIYIKIRN